MARPIKKFVDVEIRKATPSASAAGFSILLVITNNNRLSPARRVRTFTTDSAVASFFGDTSEEYYAANAYFLQDTNLRYQPEVLKFGRYQNVDSGALLEMGDSPENDIAVWQAVTNGEFTITIDSVSTNVTGLNFSTVTSLDDVASVVTTGLGVAASCYYLINRFNIVTVSVGASSNVSLLTPVSGGTGTDISGPGYLDGDALWSITNPGGSYISGGVAETASEAVTEIENKDNDFTAYAAIKSFRDTADAETLADLVESRRKQFFIETNDPNVLVFGSTSTASYYVKNQNYRRTNFIYYDNSNLYPMMSWLGQQLPKPVGSTNWSFKTLAGIAQGALNDIDPVSLTEDQINAALDVNCNLYTETLGASRTYYGTAGGGRNIDKDGEYIDIVRNIDYLQARIEEGLFNLALTVDIIPYTDAGIAIYENELRRLLEVYGINTGILVDGSIIISFPKRSEVSETDRDNRILPDGTFTAELQGAINKVIIRGTVYV